MKILVSAQTVRQAHASGQSNLPGGNNVLITPEARDLARQMGIGLDPNRNTLDGAPSASQDDEMTAIRAAVLARLPKEVASNPELVAQIVHKVGAAMKTGAIQGQPSSSGRASASTSQPKVGIKLVKGADVRLGDFAGAGPGNKVGIADVITAADGAPIAAGFMAWHQCFFPWTLDYDEIDIVLEGELHIRCEGQTFVGKVGDVLFIPKGSAIEFGSPGAVRFFYVTYPANWQG